MVPSDRMSTMRLNFIIGLCKRTEPIDLGLTAQSQLTYSAHEQNTDVFACSHEYPMIVRRARMLDPQPIASRRQCGGSSMGTAEMIASCQMQPKKRQILP